MRERIRFALMLILLMALGMAAGADEIDDFIQKELEKRKAPGASIAVLRDGKVLKTKGYGLANVEHSVPATAETVYQLASVTKQFTAAGILLLAEEGKLSIEDGIRRHLPDLPAAWEEVTIRHLLNHTSGIKSYTSTPDIARNLRKDFGRDELLKLVVDAPMEFKPGEKFAYNNTGYFLLGMIIEKVCGKSYGEFMDERIFRPLGMTSTRLNDLRAIIKNRAAGYSVSRGSLVNGEYVSPTQPFAAGALVSTVADMAKWDAALYSDSPLSKKVREWMWTESRLNDGKPAGYGFGWSVGKVNGRPMVGHGGGIPGFSTQISRYLEDKLTVIVLANSDSANAGSLAAGIAGIVEPSLKREPPKPIADAEPEITEMLKKAFLALASGNVEGAPLTDSFRAFLTPERLSGASEQLKGLGALKSFTLIEAQQMEKAKSYRYRVVFGETPVIVQFVVTEDRKIAGANLMPE